MIPGELQDICRQGIQEALAAQWFQGYRPLEKLQKFLQKAYFPGKEVILNFQMPSKSCKSITKIA